MSTTDRWIASLEPRRLLSAGEFDAGFGNDGRVFATSNANPEASNAIEVQVQSDGKLVEALTLGDAETAALRRYGPDGQLDATFGTNGTVKLPPQTIDAITIQKDGKILAGGEFGKAFAVTRLNPDGTIDKSFNLDGTQHVSFTTYQAVLKDLLVQPDGKVLIAGGLGSSIAMARLLSNGQIDSSFGDHGVVRLDPPGSSERIRRIALQPDGKIVAVGYSSTSSNHHQLTVARFTASGKLDQTFGTDGIDRFFEDAVGNAVTIFPGGKILVGGENEGFDFNNLSFILRLDAKGKLDSSFADQGIFSFSQPAQDIVGEPDFIDYGLNDMQVAANGKIYFAGGRTVARLNSNGTLDLSFGSNDPDMPGVRPEMFHDSAINSMRLLSNGKIVLAENIGVYLVNDTTGGLVQLTSTGAPDPSFSDDGTTLPNDALDAESYSDLATLPDGRFYVVGTTPGAPPEFASNGDENMAIERRLPDGALDPTFGIGGRVAVDALGFIDQADCVAVQSDGRILVGGYGLAYGGPQQALVVRLLPSGMLDATFGKGGVATINLNRFLASEVDHLAVLPDGQILADGVAEIDETPSRSFLARLTQSGKQDTTFGGGDDVVFKTVGATQILLQNDHVIIPTSTRIYRLSKGGIIDPTFGDGGVVKISGTLAAAALAPDGGIIVVGRAALPEPRAVNFSIFRLTANGASDSTFGTNGITTLPGIENAGGALVQSDGTILATGDITVRLSKNGASDTTFGDAGIAAGLGGIVLSETASNHLLLAGGNSVAQLTLADNQPAVTFATLSHTGTLLVMGTSDDDIVNMTRDVRGIDATVNGQSRHFSAASVRRISVDAGAGNDIINNSTSLVSTLLGGSGDDQITGGNAADTIDGGDGADTLAGGKGDDLILAHDGVVDSIDGGAGPTAPRLIDQPMLWTC